MGTSAVRKHHGTDKVCHVEVEGIGYYGLGGAEGGIASLMNAIVIRQIVSQM